VKKFVIITGISGAGKSCALRTFEDMGYYCIDNLPCNLIPDVMEMFEKEKREGKIAMTIDIREEEFFDYFEKSLEILKNKNKKYTLLFLEAKKEIIMRRYEETRRVHPLQKIGFTLNDALDKEIDMLRNIKEKANLVIDTSELTIWDLRKKLKDIFEEKIKMQIEIITFGFKYGIPTQLDLLFDVRFLPNPHYIDELKKLNGKDERVKEFVLNSDETKKFMEKLKEMLDFLIPSYEKEGKVYLVIGFGCTGGSHRSVVIGEEIKNFLEEKGYGVEIYHRDIEK
jgi:UPF0042 nucleotide-binding protein